MSVNTKLVLGCSLLVPSFAMASTTLLTGDNTRTIMIVEASETLSIQDGTLRSIVLVSDGGVLNLGENGRIEGQVIATGGDIQCSNGTF